MQLEKQVKSEEQQYIKLNEKLIQAEKTIKNLTKSDIRKDQESHENDDSLVEKLEEAHQKLQDSEQSIKVLKRIKTAYKQALELKCRGCNKMFKATIFKAHILNCQMLMEDSESFQEISQYSNID